MKFYKKQRTPPWFVVVTGGDGGGGDGGAGCGGGGTDDGGAGDKMCRLQTQDNVLSYILVDCLLIENHFDFLGNTRDYDVRGYKICAIYKKVKVWLTMKNKYLILYYL